MMGQMEPGGIEALLKEQFVARIGCHMNGEVYVVPVSYAYDGKYLYAHSLEGKKLEMMRNNPDVCIEVDDVTDMANWKSVIGWGKYEELKNENEKIDALKILLNRHLPLSSSITTHLGKTWPFSEDELKDISGVVFRIAIEKKTGRYELTSLTPKGVV